MPTPCASTSGEQRELLVIELSQIKASGAKPLKRIWSVVVVAHLDLLQDGVVCGQDHATRLSAGWRVAARRSSG